MNDQAILRFILQAIVPVVLAVIGVLIIASARKGKMSDTMSTAAIAVVGIIFVVGAGGLIALGDELASTVFTR